jgi:hypothetical protein
MKITETIMQRRSVRTYTGEPLDEATLQAIREYIAGVQAPFGAKCRIETISASASASAEAVKLGTYGSIKGAANYLALIIEGDDPIAEVGAAFAFEQVVLFCTTLGLGTCWLGGFFSRGGFTKRLKLRRGERLRIVSPVGYAADKPHLSLLTLFGSSKPTPRKPFEVNFFDHRFGEPLTREQAGAYALPLEMVRLAPSANNKQSWRVVMGDGKFDFYKSASFGFDNIDLGIALCHFELTCAEAGLKGRFEVRTDAPEVPKVTYVISWIEQ